MMVFFPAPQLLLTCWVCLVRAAAKPSELASKEKLLAGTTEDGSGDPLFIWENGVAGLRQSHLPVLTA